MSFYRGAIIYNLPNDIIPSALACLQLCSSAPKKCLFLFGMVTNNTFQFQSGGRIIPIVDWELLSACIYFCCTWVTVLAPWWMSPHPRPLLWCGLSLSLIVGPSHPVSTFWCLLCALPDRISNKKSLSFWFLAEWEDWPLAFGLDNWWLWVKKLTEVVMICSLLYVWWVERQIYTTGI